ncbi:MAG: ABC transporter permease subunit [Bryobacteraceae bacterium]|jgi:ABC-type dipeptide/oligopeptide/nickel transport system permease subunit
MRTIAICFLVVVVLAALLPVRYEYQFRDSPNAGPSKQFPLGTDDLGRDRLSRLLYGTRVSLLLATAAATLSCLTAAVLGGIAGLGIADTVILGTADLFLSLPWLFLLLMVRAFLPLNVSPMVSVTITFLLLGALGWAAPAKVVRAAVRKLDGSDFMLQARATGSTRLLSKHLIPNVMPILWAQLWITIPAYVLAETTLGMLGLGVMEPLPSWGNLLRELEGGALHPWLLAPVLLLAAVVGSFQVILQREDYSA